MVSCDGGRVDLLVDRKWLMLRTWVIATVAQLVELEPFVVNTESFRDNFSVPSIRELLEVSE